MVFSAMYIYIIMYIIHDCIGFSTMVWEFMVKMGVVSGSNKWKKGLRACCIVLYGLKLSCERVLW